MITLKSKLIKSLDLVKPAVGAKDNNMQQDCFVFHGGGVLAFNDDVCASTVLHETMEGLDDFAVQAKEFYALISKLAAEEIEIELKDDCLKIGAGRANCKFKVQREIKMPLDDLLDWGGKGAKVPDHLNHAMSLVVPACGKDMTKPLTTCVYLSENTILATDNYCAARYCFDDKFQWQQPLYLPAATARLLSGYELASYTMKKDSWIRFATKDEDCTIDCRSYYKGQPFADVHGLFEQQGETLILPSKLAGALERAGVFVKSVDTSATAADDPFVRVLVESNRITISGKGSVGEYSESIRTDYTGKTRSFTINASLLMRALKEEYDCELCGHFMYLYNDNYGYVVAYANYDK